PEVRKTRGGGALSASPSPVKLGALRGVEAEERLVAERLRLADERPALLEQRERLALDAVGFGEVVRLGVVLDVEEPARHLGRLRRLLFRPLPEEIDRVALDAGTIREPPRPVFNGGALRP